MGRKEKIFKALLKLKKDIGVVVRGCVAGF
jgi:hypothetical protein